MKQSENSQESVKKVTLDSGLEIEISENVTNNMELLDDLVSLDEGNGYAISRITGRILEKSEKKKLYDHLRENGKVPIDKVVEALKEIFDKMGADGKN